jgi:hypothetical protein
MSLRSVSGAAGDARDSTKTLYLVKLFFADGEDDLFERGEQA